MKIGILTEGNGEIGYGHISRCISIGQALNEAGHSTLMVINGDDRVRGIPNTQGALVYDWYSDRNRLFADVGDKDALFLDTITIPDPLLFELMAWKRSAIIDDYKRREYAAGLIIDWTIQAEKKYPGHPREGLEYLLGAKFTALRKGFWNARTKPDRSAIEEILITFGGTDIRNLTSRAIAWILDGCPRKRITAIVGNGVRNADELKARFSGKVRILANIDENKMASVMGEADLALAAGGQTLYELARMGVPTIAITVVDNQIDDVTGWEEAGFLYHAGWWDDPDLDAKVRKGFDYFSRPEIRDRHSAVGRAAIDGLGARRIVQCMEARFSGRLGA